MVYDVDRKPLGFELKLDDFDVGFEPGTEQATHFESKVRLTDKSAGIKDKPHTISMNHPLDHRGYTFYQSNYIRVRDPHTGESTGQFQSVFQVATNPGRPIIYAGCMLVVLGTSCSFTCGRGSSPTAARESASAHRRKTNARTQATMEDNLGRPKKSRPRLGEYLLLRSKVRAGRASRRLEHETNRQATRWAGPGRRCARPCLPARAAEEVKSPGSGPAYELIGKVAVMHEGRVKPLDTVAREEVKQVYSRETIKLHDPREEVEKILDPDSHQAQGRLRVAGRERWGPVGAFLGWTIRPEFWDDQPFILVDYLPLRTADRGRDGHGTAQGDRRQVDHPRRSNRPACKSSPRTPS